MTNPTVIAGNDCPIYWTHDDVLDTATASLTISLSSTAVVGPTAVGIGDLGGGHYGYVWRTTTATTPGQYTAVLSGTIDGDAVTETVTITVSARTMYISLATLKDELGITGTARNDSLTRAIVNASRAIEIACNERKFTRDGVVSARIYTPNGRIASVRRVGEVLLVDDFATETGLLIAYNAGYGSTWTSVDASTVTSYPGRMLSLGRAATGILRLAGGLWNGLGRIRVTAEWGWPEVPAEVESAVLLQAMRLSRRHLSPEGVTGMADFGGPIRVPRLDPDVRAMIEHLILPVAGG